MIAGAHLVLRLLADLARLTGTPQSDSGGSRRCAGVAVACALQAAQSAWNEVGPAAQHGQAATALGAHHESIGFEANRGQSAEQVKFLARTRSYTVFLTSNEAVLVLRESRGMRRVVRMSFVGAGPSPTLEGLEALPGRVHYFRDGHPQTAITDVPTYAKVKAVGVYPGIDVVYHWSEGELEYDFAIAPMADPTVISLAFEGAERLELDRHGELLLHTATGKLRQRKPFVYQVRDGVRRRVSGEYVLHDSGRVGLRLGMYDRSQALIIDPTLIYSSYLGGSRDEEDPLYGPVVGIAVDAGGNAYVTGTTQSSDFPTTAGADRTRGGNQDAFVTKLSASGAILYSTYLGGPCDDIARAIAVNAASGEAYVTGRAHDRCNVASPGVLVAKLSATGAPAYFFTFGGSFADTSVGQAIVVVGNGQAYVTGLANSSSRDFPTTPGALRITDCGAAPNSTGSDSFVAKVNAAGNGLLYSTYLCGSAHESANAIAVDASGHAYVTGSTASNDFPTSNAYQPNQRGDTNAFVAKLAADGSALLYSTYLGGRFNTVANGIDVDLAGNAYVVGATQSDDFPTTAAVLQPRQLAGACPNGICTDAFVSKLNPSGSGLVYSTYLFGELVDVASAIKVDAAGNAYVVGETASLYFPVLNAFQARNRGLSDGFVAKLNSGATRLLYSSYLGGGKRSTSGSTTEGSDTATGVALHAATGEVYVSGHTNSLNFPTAAAFQPAPGGGVCFIADGTPCRDAFVTKITAGGAGVTPPVTVTVSPTDVAAGGTIVATWSGIPAPTARDELRLYPIGALADENSDVASWLSNGTASGSRTLNLPVTLTAATYELRLLSPDPKISGLFSTIARSQPIYLGPRPDLVESALSNPPAATTLGAAFPVTDTVLNRGTSTAAASTTRYYLSLDPIKSTSDILTGTRSVPALASGKQSTGTVQLRLPSGIASTSYFLLACADDRNLVVESSETNNCRASGSKTAVKGADLRQTALSNPPASTRVGGSFAVSDTVSNHGTAGAAASTTRYYLSLDTTKSTGDKLLTGGRMVPVLAPGAASSGSVVVSIPTTTVAASYRLLACADDQRVLAETSDGNNCRASATAVSVSP